MTNAMATPRSTRSEEAAPRAAESAAGMTPFRAEAPEVRAVPDLGAGRGPDWLDTALAETLPSVLALRRDLHAHPELSGQETRTTAALGDALAGAGIHARPLSGGTGLIAEIGDGPGPVIGLRADIDALPIGEETGLPFSSTVDGVSHACGHDVHTAVLLAAARALAVCPSPAGRVRLLFQPAEETMSGARALVEAGAAEGLDRAFALHCDPHVPVGQVGLRSGPITAAADIVEIEATGPGGHTSRPHLTIDVVGALGRLATELPALLAHRLDPRGGVSLVFGHVATDGRFNVIPRRGTLTGTLRALDRDAWLAAKPLLAELVGQVLAPTGAGYELRHERGLPPVVNDDAAVAALRSGVTRGLGPGGVMDASQSMGAEDFAVLLDEVPGALARLGVWSRTAPQVDLHSATFAADERAIAVGARTLVHAVLASWAGEGS